MHLISVSGSNWQVEILDPLPPLSQTLTERWERACGYKYLNARAHNPVARPRASAADVIMVQAQISYTASTRKYHGGKKTDL